MSAGLIARALYAFQGTQEGDLTFQEDDIIRIIEQDGSGWWSGQTDDGRRGDFPYNYVELISPEEMVQIRETSRMVTESRYNRKKNNTGDSISKGRVLPVKQSTNFTVDLLLSTKKKVSATKSMSDFRILDENIRFIYPNFDRPLPPMWADKVYVSEDCNKKRAKVLEIYVEKLIGTETTEFALLNWLDQREANGFNVNNDVKNTVRNAEKNGARNGAGRNSFNVAMMNVCPLARCEYEWLGNDAVELSFRVGDIIAIRAKDTASKGWWEGETSAGERGLFPSNHVMMLDQNQSRAVVLGEGLNPSSARGAGTGGGSPLRKKPSLGGGKKYGTASPSQPAVDVSNVIRKGGSKGGGSAPGGMSSSGSNRQRKTEANFAMPSLDAFDELLIEGFTMLANNKVFTPKSNANSPCEGDAVTLSYTAYVWDCQKQRIIEFASSDLPDSRNYVGPLKFIVGKGETIKALERAVQNLEKGQESRIIVRPDLGYGDVGNPPSVPPNCHLVYDVRLESFDGATLPGPPAMDFTMGMNVPKGGSMGPTMFSPGSKPTSPMGMPGMPGMPMGVGVSPMVMQMPPVPGMGAGPAMTPVPQRGTNNGNSPKSLVDAIASRAEKMAESENTNNYSSNAPIGARPRRQPPNMKKAGHNHKKGKGGGGGGGKSKVGGPSGGQGSNMPKAAPPSANLPKYDLNKMREINDNKDYERYQVNPAYLEDQLNDEAFQEAFRMPRAEYLLLPKWKQNKMKKDIGLY